MHPAPWDSACTHTKWLRHAICDRRAKSNWWAISLEEKMMIGFSFYKTLKVRHGPSVAPDADFDRRARANCTSPTGERFTWFCCNFAIADNILVQFHPRSSSSSSLYCESARSPADENRLRCEKHKFVHWFSFAIEWSLSFGWWILLSAYAWIVCAYCLRLMKKADSV